MTRPLSPPIDPADLEFVLQRGRGYWEALRNKSFFITGGTGLFGRWLLESAIYAEQRLNLGLEITVLTRDYERFIRQAPHMAAVPNLNFHCGEVSNFDFPDTRHTHFIHGATTSAAETFGGESPLHKFDTLVSGTRRTLDFAATCNPERFLFLSSGAVYGPIPDGMGRVPESFSGAPDTTDVNSALGEAKRAAEFLSNFYAEKHGWDNVVARCFSFAGPLLPLDLHYAIGNFIGQSLRNEDIIVKGDGAPIRSYMYMADLVVWLLALLTQKTTHRVYNVGSDQAISIKELALLVRDTLNSGKSVRVMGQSPYSVGNIIRNSYVPDISRARCELSLEAWTPLKRAIEATAGHLLKSNELSFSASNSNL